MVRDRRPTWSDAEPDEEPAIEMFTPHAGLSEVRCPPPEIVQASQMKTLPADVQEGVATHVAGCAVCQALADALGDPSVADLSPHERERILARVRNGIAQSTRAVARRRWRQVSATAAGLAIVGLGSIVGWRLVRPSDEGAIFRLEKPARGAGAATELVWRGSNDSTAARDLSRALEPYIANDFAQAARRLTAFVSQHPQSASGHFYLGVSDLFLGAAADAVAALESAERLARDDADLAPEIAWYLALAYQRTGQREQATGRLRWLCQGQSSRAAQACTGLDQLSTGSSPPRSR